MRRAILRRQRYPVECDLRQGIRHAGDLHHIRKPGGAAYTGIQIDDFYTAAIRAHIDVIPVQGQILLWQARRQAVRGWGFLQGSLDQLARRFHHLRGVVHLRAMLFPDPKGAFGWKAHTGIGNHIQGGGVQALHVLIAEDFELQARAADG